MKNGQIGREISSTYRLQFYKGFPFSAGERLADYLSDLGVSHVYASPILTARAGSLHGYDVIDYRRINPELGGVRIAQPVHEMVFSCCCHSSPTAIFCRVCSRSQTFPPERSPG